MQKPLATCGRCWVTSLDRIIQLLKHQFDLQQVNLINTHNHSNTHSKFLVFGQAQRLEQVLINLINNARDALLVR